MGEQVLIVLLDAVGAVIVGIRRIRYNHHGSLDASVGALEVEFAGGRWLLFDSGADGESLTVVPHQWEDPFSEDGMTLENLEFVARSGKWTGVDVSRDFRYGLFVGARVEEISHVRAPSGKVVGAVIRTTAGDLRVDVEADDLYVQIDS